MQERCGCDPWVGKIPWRRKWKPTPVFLPRKSCGQRSLAGCKKVGHDLATKQQKQAFCCCSVAQSCLTLHPYGLQHAGLPCPSLSPAACSNSLVMPSNHLILCHSLLLLSIFLSIRVFSNESSCHIRWPEYWSFIFIISLYNEYSGLISFRIDWFDLLAVQGTLTSLLQHHCSKASIL